MRVTVRIFGSPGMTQDFSAERRRFVVCAELVCARARDYNTLPHNTTVTKFTFDDLT